MTTTLLGAIRRHRDAVLRRVHRWFLAQTKPAKGTLVGGTIGDVTRSKVAVTAENALLRQQLIVLQRPVKRPMCTPRDRLLLVLLARLAHRWRTAGGPPCSSSSRTRCGAGIAKGIAWSGVSGRHRQRRDRR